MSPELLALVLSGIMIHLFVDWFLQNDWMAQNKMKWVGLGDPHPVTDERSFYLPHPAGLVHASSHSIAMLLVFPWYAALLVGVLHWFIDLRFSLVWWRRTFHMTTDPNNPAAMHVAIWQDQVAHFLVIAAVATLVIQ